MAKYAINASGAMFLLNLIQVTESISGFVVPVAMFSLTHWQNQMNTMNTRKEVVKVCFNLVLRDVCEYKIIGVYSVHIFLIYYKVQ